MSVPTRFQPTAEIRARFGERIDRLAPFLTDGDPLADAAAEALAPSPRPAREALLDAALTRGIDAVPEAPSALRALFAELDHVPFWLDRTRADRGGAAFVRSGILGGFTLGLCSLPGGYCSPAGNKPLVFSGRLQDDVPRRLAETARFVQVVCAPGGMRRDGEGFRTTVRVRLIHAQVRRMLSRAPAWRGNEWGLAINQYDMAGTVLLFSQAVGEGLRRMGFGLTDSEFEDLLHLWRYAGYLLGVREELLCSTVAEATDLWAMITDTQAPPDADSRALARALIEHPVGLARSDDERARAERFVGFAYALSRQLLGDARADGLGYPRNSWRFALPAMRALLARADALRRGIPLLGERLAHDVGMRYWNTVVREGSAAGGPVGFPLPEALPRIPAR